MSPTVLTLRRIGIGAASFAVSISVAWINPAIAQEFVVSDRPALPYPTAITFGPEAFDPRFETFGEIASFSIKPLDGLQGFGLEVLAGETPTADALVAQAEFFGDISHTAESIQRATIEESICGPFDDSQHVELYDGSGRVPRAFVDTYEPTTLQLQWSDRIGSDDPEIIPGNVRGVRWCSGTYIGNGRVLTAGHCFRPDNGARTGWITPSRRVDGIRQFLQPSELAPLFVVNFRYQLDGNTGDIRAAVPFPVSALVEYSNGGLDYAIIDIGPAADGRVIDEYTTPAALGDTGVYNDGSVIAIIQHPRGDPKKVASGQILGRLAEWLYYDDVDTLGGSSGSGIVTSDGNVIGVHTHGGCDRMSPVGDTRRANAGVSLTAIRSVSAALSAPP